MDVERRIGCGVTYLLGGLHDAEQGACGAYDSSSAHLLSIYYVICLGRVENKRPPLKVT